MRVSMQGQEVGPRPLIYSDSVPLTEAHVCLHGRVVDVGFEDFLSAYYTRLGLNLRIDHASGDRLQFDVSGKPELVDMLLTVCWLGPSAAMVNEVKVDFVLRNDVSGTLFQDD